MTNIDSWPIWAAIFFSGGPILLGGSGIVYSLYLRRYHLEDIKRALVNSRYIYLWGPSLGRRGLIWSLLEMSKIAGMVVLPRASIIMGEVDPVDVEKFPPYLKRLLVIDLAIMIVACVWMGIVVMLLRFR